MLPGPLGRMDVRVRGPAIVRWTAQKDRLEPKNDLSDRHRLGRLLVGPASFYANRMSPVSIEVRANRLRLSVAGDGIAVC